MTKDQLFAEQGKYCQQFYKDVIALAMTVRYII